MLWKEKDIMIGRLFKVLGASIISCFQYLDTIYEDTIIYSFINLIHDKKIIYKIELYKHYDTR